MKSNLTRRVRALAAKQNGHDGIVVVFEVDGHYYHNSPGDGDYRHSIAPPPENEITSEELKTLEIESHLIVVRYADG
jgi:hypothetical protein